MAGIYKRGEIYWARAQRGGKEHRTSLGTRDRRVAEERLRKWLDTMDAMAWGEKPPRPFRDAVKRFIQEHFRTLKPASAKRYAVSLKALSRTFGELNIQQITKATLSEFETNRRTEGATAPSIRRDLACLSVLMSYGEEWEWIDTGANIIPGYLKSRGKKGLKESPGRTRYLSDEEESALLKEANEPIKTAIILAIETGLRDQELMTLTWPQIDFEKKIIRTTRDTKNRRARMVPLARLSAQSLKALPRHISSLFIFTNEDGERVKRFVKGFKGACARVTKDKDNNLDLSDLRWHDLRRTAGCRWLRDGMSMEEVSLLLGHSSVAVTEKSYAFLDEEEAAQKAAQSKRTIRKRK